MRIVSTSALIALMAVSGLAVAAEQLETFESATFSNHTVIVGSRSTDQIVVAIEAGGVDNMKEVTDPAALFVGFNPSDPVTEMSIEMATGQPFTLTRLRLSNQFEMEEDIHIKALRSGHVVGEFTSEVPWPEADVFAPAGDSFRLVDEVRIAASDLYFYLEDVGFDLEGGLIESTGPSDAHPVPLFGFWPMGVLMAFVLGLFGWRRLGKVSRRSDPFAVAKA